MPNDDATRTTTALTPRSDGALIPHDVRRGSPERVGVRRRPQHQYLGFFVPLRLRAFVYARPADPWALLALVGSADPEGVPIGVAHVHLPHAPWHVGRRPCDFNFLC